MNRHGRGSFVLFILEHLLGGVAFRAIRDAEVDLSDELTHDELMDLRNGSDAEAFLHTSGVKWGRPDGMQDCLSDDGRFIGGGSFGSVYSVEALSGGEPTNRYVAAKVQEPGKGINHEIEVMEYFRATSVIPSYVWITQILASGEGGTDGQVREYYWAMDRRSGMPTRTYKMVRGTIPKGILVMELARSDLTHYTPTQRGNGYLSKVPLAPVAALTLFTHVLYGLRAMHEPLCASTDCLPSKKKKLGMVHGDIKPGNVFVFGDCFDSGVYPVGDCFAKIGDLGSVLKEGQTRKIGGRTDMYDPPEQRDAKTGFGKNFPTHPAADMWAAGLILFELIFQQGTPMQALDRAGRNYMADYDAIYSRSRPWPSHWNENEALKQTVSGLIGGLLAFNPQDRWSARQALAHLASGSTPIGNGDGDPPSLDPPPDLGC